MDAPLPPTAPEPEHLLSRVVRAFLVGPLSPVLLLLSVVAAAAAVLFTPREEEPQIVVPMADVFVSFPGASAEEVEKLVTTPLERLLWQEGQASHGTVPVAEISRSTTRNPQASKKKCSVRTRVGEPDHPALGAGNSSGLN